MLSKLQKCMENYYMISEFLGLNQFLPQEWFQFKVRVETWWNFQRFKIKYNLALLLVISTYYDWFKQTIWCFHLIQFLTTESYIFLFFHKKDIGRCLSHRKLFLTQARPYPAPIITLRGSSNRFLTWPKIRIENIFLSTKLFVAHFQFLPDD